MIQLKQNKFRVAFLTSGAAVHSVYKGYAYLDPRTSTAALGAAFVSSMNMKGLSLLADDVLDSRNKSSIIQENIDYIRSRNLALYLWGSSLNNTDLVMRLKNAGVDALILDK